MARNRLNSAYWKNRTPEDTQAGSWVPDSKAVTWTQNPKAGPQNLDPKTGPWTPDLKVRPRINGQDLGKILRNLLPGRNLLQVLSKYRGSYKGNCEFVLNYLMQESFFETNLKRILS